jgi:DNA-binding transcriptional LysR family regulator
MSEELELSLLRTFLEAIDAGGVMRAASRVGRTRSAVSLQMRRLENRVGRPLFQKVGRRLELTPAGEALNGWARRLLTLNDEALAALRDADTPERIRIGAPQDVVERFLPPILGRFAARSPLARLELVVDHSRVLAELAREGKLDLSVRFSAMEEAAGKRIGSARVRFFASPSFAWNGRDALPLVLLEPPCVFRSMLLDALDGAGIPWRVAVICPGVSALWASVAAGLGVTARADIAVPRAVRRFRLPQQLTLPSVALTIHGGETRGVAVRGLRTDIELALRSWLGKHARDRRPG